MLPLPLRVFVFPSNTILKEATLAPYLGLPLRLKLTPDFFWTYAAICADDGTPLTHVRDGEHVAVGAASLGSLSVTLVDTVP